MEDIKLYPRKCDITGEGMDEGYCIQEGAYYIKYEKDFIKHIRNLEKEDNPDYNKLVEDGKLTDEFLINDYYNQGYYYWTEWEELDSEINYTENGQEVQNI